MERDTMHDDQLVDLSKAGDREAFGILYDRHRAMVGNIAFQVLRNRNDCEDVVQDVFFFALRGIKNFDSRSKFTSWIYRITYNRALEKKRRLRSRPEGYAVSIENRMDDGSIVCMDFPDTHRYAEQAVADIDNQKLLKNLPLKLKEVIYFKYILGLEEKEAKAMGMSVGTYKSRLHYARKKAKENASKAAFDRQ